MTRLRAMPITKELVAPREGDDAYPDGHHVHAATELMFPSKVLYPDENVDDDIPCDLLSPGQQVGGKAGGDEEAAFEAEALALTRVLMHLGVIISEE